MKNKGLSKQHSVFSDIFEDWEKSYDQTQNKKIILVNDCQAKSQCDVKKRAEMYK